MKNQIGLKFWQAFSLYIGIQIVYVFFYITIRLIFKNSFHSDAFYISLQYLSILLYLPVIFMGAKKQNIKIQDLYFVPDLQAVIKMFVIILLARFIVIFPLYEPSIFFKLLMNSQLTITGLSTRPLFPLLDLRMILIVPIIEELFFRGFILKSFLRRYPPIYAILLSSLLFGLHHESFENLFYYITLGVIFGVLFYAFKSLAVSTMAHIVWNSISFFRAKYIDLDVVNSIFFLVVYVFASFMLIFFIKKCFKTGSKVDTTNEILHRV